MKKIQIITDSTAYFTRKYLIEEQIQVVPLMVQFCGTVSKEGFPGEFDEFYRILKETKEFPTTSQPSVGDFVKTYKSALETYEEIITIVISSELSGTYNSARLAADIVNSEKITVIDSRTSAGNLKVLVEKANELAKQGYERTQIVNEILSQIENMSITLTVDTLEYLKRGGRLSNTSAFLGNLLNIKPIIGLIDGKLVPIGKERGKRKAMNKIVSMVPEQVKKIVIAHVQNLGEAQQFKEILEEKFKNVEIIIDELGPVLGSHLGPKAIGLCASW